MCKNNPDEIQNIPKYMHLQSKMIKRMFQNPSLFSKKKEREKGEDEQKDKVKRCIKNYKLCVIA